MPLKDIDKLGLDWIFTFYQKPQERITTRSPFNFPIDLQEK